MMKYFLMYYCLLLCHIIEMVHVTSHAKVTSRRVVQTVLTRDGSD